MRTAPLTAALNDGVPLVALSPHLDDAILSCGALLTYASARTPVTLATVFTEGGRPPYTLSARQFLRQVGAADAEQLYRARRAEDRRLLASMGVVCHHAGLTDALFRRKPETPHGGRWRASRSLPELLHIYPTYRLHISSGRIADHDADTLRRVCQLIETLLSGRSGLVLAPGGVGGHVDHLLVRAAAELSGRNVVYYSEFPYNQRHTIDPEFVRRNGLIPITWSMHLATKPTLVRAYGTQANALFPGGRIPVVPEVYLLPRGWPVRSGSPLATGC
jgi:LmbE family N-acetylglucosaminyl deacetylase